MIQFDLCRHIYFNSACEVLYSGMKLINAYKRKAYYSDERYRCFLKQNLLTFNPIYYSIVAAQCIETPVGQMYAVQLVKDIEDPQYEAIAEVWLNHEFVYLWRDHCWLIAVDQKEQWIVKLTLGTTKYHSDSLLLDVNNIPIPCNKTMVIHQVGVTPIE